MKWQARSLIMAESLFEFAAGLFGPIYAIFVEKIGGDILTAGWAWSVFAIVTGITLFVMGKIEDRIKKDKWVVFIGFIIPSFALLGYVFVTQPWHLFVVQAILGFGWAFGTPALDSLFAKNLDKNKTDSGWATMDGSVKIVEGVSAFVGSYIAFRFGFKTLFIIMFLISLVAVFVVSRLVFSKKKKHH